MKTENWQVSGRVQGVGFRIHALQEAKKHHINGTVRNQIDGSVEIIAQGSTEDIENYYQSIQKPAHTFMKIDQIKRNTINSSKKYHDFNVVY